MFILHNVPKNKRQVRTSHPCKIWYEGSFLLFKYFLMTCHSATKIRFECLSTAEPRPQKKKKKIKSRKKGKTNFTPNNAVSVPSTICIRNRRSQKDLSRVVATITDAIWPFNSSGFPYFHILCIFHVSNRASINRCASGMFNFSKISYPLCAVLFAILFAFHFYAPAHTTKM